MKRFILISFKIFLLLLTIGVLWGSWYLYYKGFSSSWRKRVSEELSKNGINLELRRLTLDPFRGLIAKDVKIFDNQEDAQVIAVVSEITLDINYSNLINRLPFLNAIDLRDTHLDIPARPGKKSSVIIPVRNLNARIMFPNQQVRVSQFECDVYGFKFITSGTLLIPEGYSPSIRQDTEGSLSGFDNFAKKTLPTILDELQKLQHPEGPVTIRWEFTGDISKLEEIRIENGSITTPELQYQSLQFSDVQTKFSLHQLHLQIPQFQFSDSHGKFFASGNFNIPDLMGKIQLRSTLDIQPLVQQFIPRRVAGEFTFYAFPQLEAILNLNLKAEKNEEKFRLLGSLSSERFALRNVHFQRFFMDFSTDGKCFLARNIHLSHLSGSLSAQVFYAPEDFKFTFSSSLDPLAFLPLLSGKAAEELAKWKFHSPPVARFSGSGSKPDFAFITATGSLQLGPAIFRGIPLLSASADVNIADRAFTYHNIKLTRKEGSASGTFTYDFGRGLAILQDVKGNLIPGDVIQWVEPKILKDIAPYRFNAPPQWELDGRIQFRGGNDTDLTVLLNAPQGMSYTLLGKDLPVESTSGRLEFKRHLLKIRDVKGNLFDGTFTFNGDVSIKKEDPGYSATVQLDRLDFEKVTKLYFNYDDSNGHLSGDFRFATSGKNPADIEGIGNFHVMDGDVFAIPVFGPLSSILHTIIPTMGYSNAREATASFSVKDGIIITDDFQVIGQSFSMLGNGKLFFLEDKIDFNIRINAKGVPGILLRPVSKLFEYVGKGSLKSPTWSPKILN